MKLRLDAHSLRLRLSEAEVATFAATGQLVESVCFTPGQALRYALERAENTTGVAVRYEPGRLTVLVPPAVADAWTGSEQIGFSAILPLAENQPENQPVTIAPAATLRILVEKDLDCKH